MREAELKELFVERRRERPRQERGCPPAERLAAAAARELSATQREEVTSHVASCPDCAVEYSLAAELRGWASETALAHGAPAGAPTPRFGALPVRRWLPLAAGIAILVAGLAVFQQRLSDSGNDDLRGASAAAPWQVSPRDESRLAAPPEQLEWTTVSGAGAYLVVLYDHESRPLWRSDELQQTSTGLPADLGLVPGRTYYWRVIARRELTEERSPLFSFRLEP